jgi:hypothetical protein
MQNINLAWLDEGVSPTVPLGVLAVCEFDLAHCGVAGAEEQTRHKSYS